MHDPIQRAISMMRANYSEPITLRDVAGAALVSPYHFSRMFHASVGVPPGRYLTAVRLFEAKRLLLTTLMNVADIVTTIGYSSVGTFTTRFTRRVGVSPTQYRDPAVTGVLAAAVVPDVDNPSATAPAFVAAPRYGGSGAKAGTLVIPAPSEPLEIAVGLIEDLIPRSAPMSSALVRGPGSTELVVSGSAGLCVAVAVRGRNPLPGMRFAGGVGHPVTVGAGQSLRIDVRLRDRAPARPETWLAVAR
ncbi:helix-turn-helix transcriptional regulator [Saccharothrix isguenensis]